MNLAAFNPGGAFNELTGEAIIVTTNATPIVIANHLVAENKVVAVEAFIVAFVQGMSAGAVAKVEGLFHRVNGNVIQSVAPRVDVVGTSFSAPQPGFALVVNTQTQAIDVQITGKAGQNIQWHVRLMVRETA